MTPKHQPPNLWHIHQSVASPVTFRCSSCTAAEIPYLGILASLVPFLFPNPLCLPIRRAAVNSLARARECMVTCLRIMRPSDTSFRIVWRELALEISFISLGSSQILRLPQPTTEAARRFWVRRLTLYASGCQLGTLIDDGGASGVVLVLSSLEPARGDR